MEEVREEEGREEEGDVEEGEKVSSTVRYGIEGNKSKGTKEKT